MLTTNTNFDTKHALAYKTPLYLIKFDSETVDYCNMKPTSPVNTLAQYLVNISGLSQKVEPEEGRASISGVQVEILDVDDEITALLATDTYYFHRKKVVIKAGYMGMAETDLLTIMTGWVTGLKLSADGLVYIFDITDPIKWMQRKIFRGAEDSTVIISGNPINLFLAMCLSTGAGTNGDHDWLAAANSLGISRSYLNVTAIEAVRDDWYPGASHWMYFSITARQKAKDFFETEIFKPLNLYPMIDGQGRLYIKPFRPPLAATDTVQSFDEDTIIGLPGWDANLAGLYNEVEFSYDWDGSVFGTTDFYIDSTSVTNRGPGTKSIEIKSKGLHASVSGPSMSVDAAAIGARRKNAVFGRFATPPIRINMNTFFSRWLSEAGDIVPFTHGKLPNVVAGTRGYTSEKMEIINRSVDWQRGELQLELLNTGFGRGTYGAISPTMTITAGADGENFTVSAADAAKYSSFTLPEITLYDSKMRARSSGKTLLTVNTTSGACTCDALGVTPSAGDIVAFANYDSATAEQKLWGYIADGSDNLGAANDDAHLIVPA